MVAKNRHIVAAQLAKNISMSLQIRKFIYIT